MTQHPSPDAVGTVAQGSKDPAISPPPSRTNGASGPDNLPSILDVLENTTDNVAILDHEWRFTFLNRHAAAVLGEGRDLIGEPLHDYFMPEKGTDAWVKTVTAAQARESAHFEFYSSNHARWFETHVHPIPSGLQIFFRDVTARRAADDALTQGEARLRLALEAAGDGAWDWNIETGRTTVSSKILQGFGYGDKLYDGAASALQPIIQRADIERVHRTLVDHLAGRTEVYDCEYRVRSRERTWRWLSVRGRVIARDEVSGRATRMVGISSDITERKAAEEKAVEQANLLSLAQSGARAGAWSYDFSTRLVTLGSRAIDLLGLPSEHPEVLGLPEWAAIVHPDDHDPMTAKFRQVLATEGNFEIEFRVRPDGGSIRWIHSVGSTLADATGKPHRLIGLMRDTTSQKEAADALRESGERLRLALEAAGDGAWEHVLATKVTTMSRRILAKLGYEPDAFPPTLEAYTALIHPDDVQDSIAAFQDHLRGHTDAYATEYRIRTATGEWLWFSDRGRTVGRDPVTGHALRIVGTHREITAKKRAEIELRRVQGELVHLSRLSAMGAMASTLAHELNQPLTAIANYARGFRRVAGPIVGSDLLADALTGMEDSAHRAGDIVRRLRAYVTKGDVEQQPEDVAELVKEACVLALLDANALGVTYSIDIGDRLPSVLVDRVQIQQVLVNLVRNAIEAMKECERRHLSISARQDGKMVEVRVCDTGPGIADAMRDELFTPFASTKADGMGVGLSICRTIVESHGGRIWSEDNRDGGTVFRFTVPSLKPSARVRRSRRADSSRKADVALTRIAR